MTINELVNSFFVTRSNVPAECAMLAGISGIDASGKGFISKILCRRLEQLGQRVALISVDGWLNLPSVRFDPDDPSGNFYRNALRLDELFERLVLPLRDRRSAEIETEHT